MRGNLTGWVFQASMIGCESKNWRGKYICLISIFWLCLSMFESMLSWWKFAKRDNSYLRICQMPSKPLALRHLPRQNTTCGKEVVVPKVFVY